MQTIVFVKFGTFSHTNAAVEAQLRARFPDHRLEVVDVIDVARRNALTTLRLNIAGLIEHAGSILRRRIDLRVARWRTAHLSHWLNAELRRRYAEREDVAFTFQTQSLFDASLPGVPNFIYSDNTYLANRTAPGAPMDDRGYSTAWRALEPSFYENAAGFFTMSANVSESLVRDYGVPEEKIACIGCGAHAFDGMTENDFPERDAASYAGARILFVGSLWELKGGPELIEAFRIVRGKRPEAVLDVVGVSPDLDEPGVRVHGRVDLSRVADFFADASVFCMPSKGDAFGIVFLESYFNRVPVVCLDLGAASDLVAHGETGFLVEHGDVEGLAARLLELLESPQTCKEFGDKGFAVTFPRYTWEHVGDAMRREILVRL